MGGRPVGAAARSKGVDSEVSYRVVDMVKITLTFHHLRGDMVKIADSAPAEGT